MEKDFAILEIEVTDYMREQFRTTFDLEIEMLQAEYEKLPDGRHSYKIIVPENKAEMVMQFIRHCMQDTRLNTKIMGIPLNKN